MVNSTIKEQLEHYLESVSQLREDFYALTKEVSQQSETDKAAALLHILLCDEFKKLNEIHSRASIIIDSYND